MRLLVTGGAGFIGSNFIRYLLSKDSTVEIINYDKLTYAANLSNLADIEGNPRYLFVRGDICEASQLAAVFAEGITHIINFAAESHVDRSISDPSPFIHTNVLGTQVLLGLAVANGIRKFVQVSTDEVYGPCAECESFSETAPLSPSSPYAASKAAADLLVLAYHHTYGLPAVISRCTNNYGPYQYPEKLIPLMITNALNDKPLPIYGDGLQVRDWLYVEDHCSALELILRRAKLGEIYNIGANCPKTNLEIVRHILATLRKPDALIQFVADRPGHDRRYAVESTKIREQLGWEPKRVFEDALSNTIRWYTDTKKW